MARNLLILILLSYSFRTMGQGKKNRYRFAQSYLGMQADWLFTGPKPARARFNAPPFGAARILLGGLHFWGKADFYLSFPARSLSLGSKSWNYSEGVVTGGRILPFGPGKNFPLPYLGIQWVTPGFSFKKGPLVGYNALSVEAGIIQVSAGSWGLEAGVHHVLGQQIGYFISRVEKTRVALPDWGVSLSLKRHLDFTAANAHPTVVKHINTVRENMLQKGGLSSLSIAMGPAATIGLRNIAYASGFPWVNQKTETAVHPDMGIGYYLHRPDMALRLSYRYVSLTQSGHGIFIQHRQNHVAVEILKFLFDYHGFVPFTGLAGGGTNNSFSARDNDVLVAAKKQWLPGYAFVFGWDIRPTDVEWFILRTNLRYVPAPTFQVEGLSASSPQLEVNFIQFVFYPQRLKRHIQTKNS